MVSFEDMAAHIAALLHLDIEHIMNVFEVTAHLQGEIESAYSMILQQPEDLPLGSPGVLHLIDIELHEPGSAAFPPPTSRGVYVASRQLARTHILHLVQLTALCQLRYDRCLVFINNEIWPAQDRRLRDLPSGQYFRVVAPPPPHPQAALRSPTLPQSQRATCERAPGSVPMEDLYDEDDMEEESGYAPTPPDEGQATDREPEQEHHPDVEMDQHSLLQLPAATGGRLTMETVAQAPWPNPSGTDPIKIDFSATVSHFDWLDQHLSLPAYDLRWDDRFNWHPASLPWLDLPWFEPGHWRYEIAIYFDGSAIPSTGKAGIGVALFVLTDAGWTFGGGLSSPLQLGATSYKSELLAGICAAKVCFDTIKLVQHHWPDCRPPTTFYYDNLSVGHQGEGLWKSFECPGPVRLFRSLIKL